MWGLFFTLILAVTSSAHGVGGGGHGSGGHGGKDDGAANHPAGGGGRSGDSTSAAMPTATPIGQGSKRYAPAAMTGLVGLGAVVAW